MSLPRIAIAIVCAHCGSKDVSRDAWGDWNEARQEWELRTVFDYAHCHVCESETRFEELLLTSEQPLA